MTPSFYPSWAYGGITRCAYELCRSLVRQGDEVTVWTTDVFDAHRRLDTESTKVDGVDVRYFRNRSNRVAYHAQLYLPRGLRAHARQHAADFDLIHLHSHRHLLNTYVAAAAQRARVPYVFTGHGTVQLVERFVRTKRVVDTFGAAKILRQAHACIAVAEVELSHFRDAGVDPARVHVIPNGLRLEDYAVLPPRGTFRRQRGLGDGPLVLFVGKITPRKGVDVLVRALAQLPAGVRLAVVGSFMMAADPLRRLVMDLGLAERVDFIEVLDGDAKLQAYVDADVVAYPSVHEIFGLVPFEGLLCGTPAVVCDDSGCGEYVQRAGGGLLVPYGDVSRLAAALHRLLAHGDFHRQCVSHGREYVRRCLGWDGIAAETQALYKRVLQDSGGD